MSKSHMVEDGSFVCSKLIDYIYKLPVIISMVMHTFVLCV